MHGSKEMERKICCSCEALAALPNGEKKRKKRTEDLYEDDDSGKQERSLGLNKQKGICSSKWPNNFWLVRNNRLRDHSGSAPFFSYPFTVPSLPGFPSSISELGKFNACLAGHACCCLACSLCAAACIMDCVNEVPYQILDTIPTL